MRVWITGYAGFIGRHVIEELGTRAVAVAGIGNPRAEPPLPPNRRIDAQVSERRLERLADLVGTPDVIIHLAGGSSVGPSFNDPAADRDRTVGSTDELLTWLSRQSLKPRLVVASSAAVYGSGHDGPIPETAATLPVSPYGRHKLIMEDRVCEMARRHEIPAIIVRLFSVYGRGLTKQFFYDLCGRIKAGESPVVLAGTGEETRDYLHGRDAAALLLAASEHAEPKVPIVNGGSGVASSIAATAELVASAWSDRFGCPLRFEFSRDVRPGDPRSLVADVNRIASWGFRPVVLLHCGIADYVGWFIESFCG